MVKRLSAVDQNSKALTNVPTPSAGTDAANKDYVDDAIDAIGGGTGDVVGPDGSDDNIIALFSGSTGKLIKGDGGVVVNDGNLVAQSLAGNGVYTYAVQTDTVDEFTPTAGVTVAGVLHRDAKTTSAQTITDGSNGKVIISADTDGGDFNIFHEEGTTKTLALYGSSAGTMNLRMLDGALLTNTIDESTSAAGVTIDGVLVKDGLVDGKDVSTLTANTGNVVGPASSSANAIAIYDGTTGKLLKNSGITIDGGTFTNINIGTGGASEFGVGYLNVDTIAELYPFSGVTIAGVLVKSGGATLNDSVTYIVDDGDATKKLQFQASGQTTATTNVITFPNGTSTTVVGTTNTQTLTNKTFTLPTISSSSASPGQTDAAGVMRYNGGYLYYGDGSAEYQLTSSSGTQTLTNKRITSRVGTVTSSATPTINTDNVDQFNITALAAAITSMTTNLSGTPTDGQKLMIRIKDNGTARAITWGASFVSSGVATLLATTVISKTHMVGFIYDAAAAKWVCVAVDATGY